MLQTRGTVMIVDDDLDVLNSTAQMVQEMGYNVVTESDGLRASLLYIEYKPDIVLTDLKMPRMNGYDEFLDIKKANPRAKVIFMTGYIDDPRLEDAMYSGAVCCLQKPIPANALKEVLDSNVK